jgi:hypothetical protein
VMFGIILAIAYHNLSNLFPEVKLRKLSDLDFNQS